MALARLLGRPRWRSYCDKGSMIMLIHNISSKFCKMLCGGAVVMAAQAEAPAGGGGAGATSMSEKSFTKPSQEVDLDFSAPGLVIEVNIKEGDAVQKGQVLAKQDVSVEAANKAM